MSTDANPSNAAPEIAPAPPAEPKSARSPLLKLPGLVAISVYMLLLAGVTVVSVLAQHTGFIYLVFAVFFIAGALGLLLLQRWAWALTLAAVAILSGSFLWGFSTQHSGSSLVQGILNLFFFLYLVRTEVRQQLK